ncbi:hypothetical protein [Cohnella caldifontis]|uniref:hypothetical protein n=1 Tax=Cohnella caldifontis TaxID=3027471 RepID=UPI0023EE175E|nr:hypothetical protein [Cohnella sp. YIM B05605]
MRWRMSDILRPGWRAGIVLCGLAAALAGCANGKNGISADKAFALSASALSGSDSYGLNGEVSILDPNGVVADYSSYNGQVTGHGQLKLTWTGGRAIRTRAADGPPAYRPLQLLSVVQHGNAKVGYADGDAEGKSPDGTVTLRLELNPDAAGKPFADGLRGEMAQLRSAVKAKKLDAARRTEANRILDDADRDLEAALSSIKASTVILWTADRKTWFPRKMSEQSELVYTWKGKTYREKRMSVTNFLPVGRNGTITE